MEVSKSIYPHFNISVCPGPHIFDRFYKSRTGRNDHHNFGLGLSIAKALADKNGFRISAGSDSCSTTFVLVMDM
ncbi:MAG: hypothetical protein ACI4KL_03195 [Lentihominibacter sp.]